MPAPSLCHPGQLRAGQRAHRKGVFWCGRRQGREIVENRAVLGSWGCTRACEEGTWGCAHGPWGRASPRRVHTAPSTSFGAGWMSTTRGMSAYGHCIHLCPRVGRWELWGGKVLCGWGSCSWGQQVWSLLLRVCGTGRRLPLLALGPGVWGEGPPRGPADSWVSIPRGWGRVGGSWNLVCCLL